MVWGSVERSRNEFIRDAAAAEDAKSRRLLIGSLMSDCLSALKLVERAWRAKHREEYAGVTREAQGAPLEAICTARERIELAVFMYVPAHRGLAPNAIADAVAKAYTQAPHATPGVSEMIQEGIRRRRVVHEVLIREGERRTYDDG